jgi:hypothetical protein
MCNENQDNGDTKKSEEDRKVNNHVVEWLECRWLERSCSSIDCTHTAYNYNYLLNAK